MNYCIGAVIGIVSAGIIGDLLLRSKHFLQILCINCVLLCLDIFLFSTTRNGENGEITNKFTQPTDLSPGSYWFYILLGFSLASNDLIYLILQPMLIAKNHSEMMAANSRF